ncbi:MAG: RNA 2'-phosphotransferase [Candidatus Eisenbacteria bacterium]
MKEVPDSSSGQEAMEPRLVKMSKLLSYILRHHPEEEGLSMDDHGWVVVRELLPTRGARKLGMTHALLVRVVAENDKQRYEFDGDGVRIRARYGHSVAVLLDRTALAPPEHLYHGTSSRAVYSIRGEGLNKRDRLYVHLCADPETARGVGARHGRPVVLVIRAREMHGRGHEFFLCGKDIWLTESVPPEFIDFSDL